jgi:hypothetical protein
LQEPTDPVSISSVKTSHETKRAKRIIVELVRQAGGQFQNKTNLFKAFWNL